MNSAHQFRKFLAFSALVLIFPAAAANAASGSFKQTISISEPIFLDVSTGSGSIEISTGNSGSVEVIGTIKVRKGFFQRSGEEAQDLVDRFKAEPPVSLDGTHLEIGHIKDRAYRKNVSISYEVVVPKNTEVKSHTGSGSQSITGVVGPVEAGTGSGKVVLIDIGGPVNASSGSGSIRAEEIAGAFEAHTGSGDIRLTQVAPGDVVVRTGSGSSELHGIVGALKARAGSGRIEVDGQQTGAWDLDTGSGSVKISLPEDAAFELDAETGSGSINIDHPLTIQGRVSKRRLKGDVRGGGDLIKIETGSGGISIR